MRLYRFKDLIGNRASIKMLSKALSNNALPNFIIISGAPGTGKSTSAEITGLRLTCMNPIGEEPCLQCESCRSNLKALKTSGESMNLVKKNLGLNNSKRDVEQIIKEIFILKGSLGNSVYILEEAHALDKNGQTALLEEIDRIDKDTYMIICTTKPYALLPELRSRAITFTFSSLNTEDLNILFDMTCARLKIKSPDKVTKQMLINYSKGVPRDLVNIIEFVSKNSASDADIKEFLGEIPTSLFIDLFSSMKLGLPYLIPFLEDIMRTINVNDLLYRIKEFLLDVLFLVEGNIGDKFTAKEKKEIKAIFTSSNIGKISSIFNKLDSKNINDVDFKYAVIKAYKVFNKSNVGAILTNNSKDASKQVYVAQKAADEVKEFNENEGNVLTELNAFDF